MTRMRVMVLVSTLVFGVLCAGGSSGAHGAAPPAIYEDDTPFGVVNPIDEHVLAVLRARGIEPARRCSDAVFVRRVYLDVIGTLPTADEVRVFLADDRADKRGRLIDALLVRNEFADYWALKWCDVLRVKSEYPINLWPNAVQAYHHWVREAIKRNMPYDDFARELLTATGSNFRVPPVNFWRAVQGQDPATLARAAALTFMGTRLEHWSERQRAGLEAFFSRLAFKGTAEWKEEIVHVDPAATRPLQAVLPNGNRVQIVVGQDPRRVFADWLIQADNPWFARCAVNRIWAWLLGRGIVHEADDFRADNPPANPVLLGYLADELVKAEYDQRHIYRLILNSATYQQSSLPRSDDPDVEKCFGCYAVRRLDAEVLIDALNAICGSAEKYTSAIPEPFTYIPEEQRTIALADGSISSPFLEMFGRPARDTGLMGERDNEPTDAQRLHLLNSSQIQTKIARSPPLRRLIRMARGDGQKLIRSLYLTILSRYPTTDEVAVIEAYADASEAGRNEVVQDLVWALLNSKEFLYRH